METLKKVILDPMIVGRKLAAKLSAGNPRHSTCIASDGPAMKPRESIAPINLKEGERVRVKSLAEIKKTLDQDGRTEGLGYMDVEMNKHCGGIYTIRKRINLFFDERRWRMLKIRNVLILDGVFCELPADAANDWAGCDRTCFLFWKEAWLERLKPEEVGVSATKE
ncbi:MAG: hypothetical protein C0407_09925 [Desulfobacca sp.]|nr:hypothetical protein [Desulfobacca sp.]